jgi:hypothetical protein
MNPSRSLSRTVAAVVGAGIMLATGACSNPFIARHKVLVDAICAPGVVKQPGQSYRLVAKKSVITQVPAKVDVVKACIDAALSTQGMFEPPPNVAPDIVIEVGFGVDATARVDPAARETFLQLSARANPERSLDRATGPELWDVRVAVLGVAGRIETAMPLLSAVAAKYIATDTKIETRIEIPQNSPEIGAVRNTAIKTLEEQAAGGASPRPPPPPQNPPNPASPDGGSAAVGASASAGGK